MAMTKLEEMIANAVAGYGEAEVADVLAKNVRWQAQHWPATEREQYEKAARLIERAAEYLAEIEETQRKARKGVR